MIEAGSTLKGSHILLTLFVQKKSLGKDTPKDIPTLHCIKKTQNKTKIVQLGLFKAFQPL